LVCGDSTEVMVSFEVERVVFMLEACKVVEVVVCLRRTEDFERG